MATIIGYLRVSTKGQGESGLGLDAQKAAIETYARQNDANVLTYYVEVESGKPADRPELGRALSHCRRSRMKLVVAKIDRLSRNLAFLAALMESKVDFVACDNPHATKLTIHLLAMIAQHEAEMIGQRTRDALAAYKRRGGKLGGERPECRNLTPAAIAKGQQLGAAASRKAAKEAYADLAPRMMELRDSGCTLQTICDALNKEGHTTRRGKSWNPVQVARVLERAAAE